MTAPDRPGDRDQQQAAGVLRKAAEDDEYGRTYVDDFVIDGDAEVVRAAIATALASVRAEEAARWQAKIAAYCKWLDDSDLQRDSGSQIAADLRALLDGEQR